jgi:hypothetical protein
MIKVGDQVTTWCDSSIKPNGYVWDTARIRFADDGTTKEVIDIGSTGKILQLRCTGPNAPATGGRWIPTDCCQLVVQPACIKPAIIAEREQEEELRQQNISNGRAFRQWLLGSGE